MSAWISSASPAICRCKRGASCCRFGWRYHICRASTNPLVSVMQSPMLCASLLAGFSAFCFRLAFSIEPALLGFLVPLLSRSTFLVSFGGPRMGCLMAVATECSQIRHPFVVDSFVCLVMDVCCGCAAPSASKSCGL